MDHTATLPFTGKEPGTKSTKGPKIEVGVFVLKDQRDSGFVKEGTENTRNPEVLTAPSRLRLPNTGIRVQREPDGTTTHIRIRFIKNCPEIDVEKQDKLGYKPNNDIETDQVYFLNGTLTVANDGETKTLFRFLTENIEFEEAPNRPDSHEPLYFRHNKEKVAEDILKNHALVSKANKIVENLYSEGVGGNDYDTERIDFLCLLLGVKAEDYASKTAALLEYARIAPERIVKAVDDHMNRLKADILQAKQLGVISMHDGKLLYMDTHEAVYTFSKKANRDEDAQLEETITFLTATETGAEFYQTMKNGVEQKQLELLQGKQ